MSIVCSNIHTITFCYHFDFTDKIFSSSSPTAQQLHSKVNLQQEKIEKKKNSHLITTTSLQQSTISNGADKSSKAGIDSKPNFLVPKPNFMSSKSPKMEKNNSENALKNAPRLPPKPSKRTVVPIKWIFLIHIFRYTKSIISHVFIKFL